jgi:ankyrin repeat protein
MNNHKTIVKLLLNSGINVYINIKDKYGWTALTWDARIARERKGEELVDILLQHGADGSFLEAPKSKDLNFPHKINKTHGDCEQNFLPRGPVSFR